MGGIPALIWRAARLARGERGQVAVAAVLGAAALGEAVWRPDSTPLAMVLALAGTVPLALARLWPGPAAALIAVTAFISLVVGIRPPIATFVAFAACGAFAGWRGTRWAWAMLIPFGVSALVESQERQLAVVLLTVAAAALAGGTLLRVRREAALRDASVRAMADSLLDYAARGERARIARELHDVVAHHLSMIAVQAEAARLTVPGMPDEGAKKLVAIGDTARTALTEMRRLLGVLREDAGPVPARQPQPGLRQLNELLDEARAGGSARLIVSGQVATLDPGIELTAYRVVQEALTNARRHAPGAAVDVELRYRDEALDLRVRDCGPGPPPDAADGHGLTGMRERVAMTGGRLTAGHSASGGFVVQATLPLSGVGE